MREERIELAWLRISDNRAYGGEGDIKILAEDMKINGIINPITVKLTSDDGVDVFDVVAGRRRAKAAKLLGWKDIPTRILEGDETERADEIAGAENINRMEMHPLDEAIMFQKLLATGETIESLAMRFDRKASAIWKRVQLLDLDENIKAMFKDGRISLLSAAMLNNLNKDAQKAFYKEYKSWSNKDIEDNYVSSFISNLDHDRLFGFLRDKQCSECKTRTYFTDKNLFPELDYISESCFNHACYREKWNEVLAGKIKNLKGKHKTHAESVLIASDSDRLQKITGSKIKIDDIEFNVIPHRWSNRAEAKDKGAQPCFLVEISNSGKLEISAAYRKEPEKESYDTNGPSNEKRKKLVPIVNLLDLPKDQQDETLDAMNNSKRISLYTLGHNIGESVFWRVIDIKAKEFNNPEKPEQDYRETFLKKYFHYIAGGDKRIFEKFAGNLSIPEIAKMPPEKIFAFLCAMEWSAYEMPTPEEFAKGTQKDILEWVGLPQDELQKIYQEEIRRRIPKKKPEPKTAKKPGSKKTRKKDLPTAGHIAEVQAKGKAKK